MSILNKQDRIFIQGLINGKDPGTYTVAEIFGAFWEKMSRPTDFGKQFKQTVDSGLFGGIRFHSKLSNNSALYAIRE